MNKVPASLMNKADRTEGRQTKSDLTKERSLADEVFKPQRRNFKTVKVYSLCKMKLDQQIYLINLF